MYVFVWNLNYPACKAHASYYSHLLPVRLYYILPYYLIDTKIFGKRY